MDIQEHGGTKFNLQEGDSQLEVLKVKIEIETDSHNQGLGTLHAILPEPKDQFPNPTENGKWGISWEVGTALCEIIMSW